MNLFTSVAVGSSPLASRRGRLPGAAETISGSTSTESIR